jgi:2-phospho-L-lactate/phosphoenolpyruvate guanylyltransferase
VKTVALVPINKLTSAKSRLADYLLEADRRDLVFWMASHVLAALRDSGVVERIAVVSPDPLVLWWVKEQGLQPLFQADDGLNTGLEVGRHWATDTVGAEALLVLLGDLPCLTPDEIVRFLPCGASPKLVLAPDQFERGTNGIVLPLGVDVPFVFGEGSLQRYQDLGRRAGLPVELFRAPGLSFDVDTLAELSLLLECGIWMPEDHNVLPVGVGSGSGGALHIE